MRKRDYIGIALVALSTPFFFTGWFGLAAFLTIPVMMLILGITLLVTEGRK